MMTLDEIQALETALAEAANVKIHYHLGGVHGDDSPEAVAGRVFGMAGQGCEWASARRSNGHQWVEGTCGRLRVTVFVDAEVVPLLEAGGLIFVERQQ